MRTVAERSEALRGPLLATGVLIAVAILVSSTEFTGSQGSPWAFILVMAIGGVALGIGRQGWDLLAIRAGAAALATLVTWVAIDTVVKHAPVCAPGEVHCASHLVVGLLLGSVPLAIPLGVVAVITNVVIGRGFAHLGLELGWSRLVPKKRWQWALLGLALLIGTPALIVLLDVPWPA